MGKNVLDYMSYEGQFPFYGLPKTDELIGRTAQFPDGTETAFAKEMAVKCDDDLFLAEQNGKLLLVEELPDESLKAMDAGQAAAGADALPEELEAWETDLCMASGYVLTALFQNGALTLKPSPEPEAEGPLGGGKGSAPITPEIPCVAPETFALEAVKIGDKRFILRFPESGSIIFLDGRRFLLYTIVCGKIATGYIEIPPKVRA